MATTPYGAGVVDQNNQLFDINWQNQQLARQGQGANNAATLIGAGSTGATSGTSVGQSVPGFSNQQVQQQIADFLAYLQGGTGAANAATSQYGAESSAALGQQTATNQGLAGFGQLGGTLLGGLGSLFGGA